MVFIILILKLFLLLQKKERIICQKADRKARANALQEAKVKFEEEEVNIKIEAEKEAKKKEAEQNGKEKWAVPECPDNWLRPTEQELKDVEAAWLVHTKKERRREALIKAVALMTEAMEILKKEL